MVILIDLDGVVVDIESGLLALWQQRYNEQLYTPRSREKFPLAHGCSADVAEKVHAMLREPGFFKNLPPMPGAVAALEQLRKKHDCYIVTSPGTTMQYAPTDKFAWVERYLGEYYLRHLIITPAKYMVQGDILIDDKPLLYKEDQASWEHVLYDWKYNQHIDDKRRMTWANWREVLLEK